MARGREWWDRWFLGLAKYVATASKDPSTQCGAVIVDGKRRVVSVGYNGFARGVDDDPDRYADRETKLKLVVHAERNAILFAQRHPIDCTLYTWPFGCCAPCAAVVIQAGIVRCVSPPASRELRERWGADLDLAARAFREAVVAVDLVELREGR